MQSFKNLFTPPSECPLCESLTNRPLRYERVPLFKKELVLFTHDHPDHPVFMGKIFETLVLKGVDILFYDSLEHAPKSAWSHASSLLDPVVVYHADFPVLDCLERMVAWFEGEVKISHVSLE